MINFEGARTIFFQPAIWRVGNRRLFSMSLVKAILEGIWNGVIISVILSVSIILIKTSYTLF